jgi:hypothetical protein
MMKPEFKVQVYRKGAEFRFNGGPTNRVISFPPLVDAWLPMTEYESVLFKVGRREFAISIARVRKGRKHGRS